MRQLTAGDPAPPSTSHAFCYRSSRAVLHAGYCICRDIVMLFDHSQLIRLITVFNKAKQLL